MKKTSPIYQYRTNDKTKRGDERHEQIAPTHSRSHTVRNPRKSSTANREECGARQRRTERSETPKAPSSKYQYNGIDKSKRGDERRNRPTSSRRHIETL